MVSPRILKLMETKSTGQSATAGAHLGERKDTSDWLDQMTTKTTVVWIPNPKLVQPVLVIPSLSKFAVQLVFYTIARIQLVQRHFNSGQNNR